MSPHEPVASHPAPTPASSTPAWAARLLTCEGRLASSFHEAGHVVAAYAFKVPFHGVTLGLEMRSDGAIGGGTIVSTLAHYHPYIQNRYGVPTRVFHWVKTFAAGPLAQALAQMLGNLPAKTVNGLDLWEDFGGGLDKQLALELLTEVGITDCEKHRRVLKAAFHETCRLLSLRWPRVEYVAQALNDHGSLSRAELLGLLRESKDFPVGYPMRLAFADEQADISDLL